jgi:pentatricopeptide repeat protein
MGSLRHLVGFRRKPRPPPSPKAIARAANRSKVLVDTWLNPPGSFSTSHYKSAREVLDVFSRARPLDLDYSHLAIFLFERIVRENATLRNNKELRWILDPRATLYPVLRIWKETRERDRGVAISPFLLVKTFQTMSEELPEFKYNEISVGRILEIVIQQSKRENAGQAALDLFDYIQNAARTPLQKYQVQSPKFYNLVINALMKSSATDAEKQIEMLIQQMHTNEVSPDLGTYQCLVKFWSDRDCVEKVDQLLAQIRDSNQFQVNGTILNEAIRCYCRIGDIGKAERALREMVDIEQQFYPTKEIETSGAWSIRRCRYDLIAHSVQNVMLAYRRRIISARILSNTDQTDAAATIWEKARTLFELRIQSHNLLDVVTTSTNLPDLLDEEWFKKSDSALLIFFLLPILSRVNRQTGSCYDGHSQSCRENRP